VGCSSQRRQGGIEIGGVGMITTSMIQTIIRNQTAILLALKTLLPDDSYPDDMEFTASLEPFIPDPYITSAIDECLKDSEKFTQMVDTHD
jgi:hypothetical protein